MVLVIVLLHIRPSNGSASGAVLHALQQKESRNTNHQPNQDYSPPKISDNEDSVVLSFSASPNAFAPSAPILLPTDTPERRDPNTNLAKQSKRAAMSPRQTQQSQQSHPIYMAVLIALLHKSTLDSPANGALHTLQQQESRNTKHQRNQDYSPNTPSHNEVSVVFSIRASPNAFVPSSPIPLSTDTPKWRDPNTNSAEQFQWATLPTRNRNNRTRYMVVLIVLLHTRL
jgi:hypothetical protein